MTRASEKVKRWRLANPGKRREMDRRYRDRHRTLIRARSLAWYHSHKVERREINRAINLKWRSNNPEKAKECDAKWRAKNRDKKNAKLRLYRANNRAYVNRQALQYRRTCVKRLKDSYVRSILIYKSGYSRSEITPALIDRKRLQIAAQRTKAIWTILAVASKVKACLRAK